MRLSSLKVRVPHHRCGVPVFARERRQVRTADASKRKKQKEDREYERNLKLLEKFLDDLVADPVDETPPLSEKETSLPIVEETPPEESKQKSSTVAPTEKTFSIQRFKSRSAPSFFSPLTFEDVELSEELRKALGEICITRPSQIQV